MPLQGLLQAEHFAAQDVQLPAGVLFAPGQFLFVLPGEPGQALLLLPGQGGELLPLLLDQLRQARRLLVLLRGGSAGAAFGGTGGVPLFFGGHLQPLRLHRGRLLVHQQAELVAPERVADEYENGCVRRCSPGPTGASGARTPGTGCDRPGGSAHRPCRGRVRRVGEVAQRQVPAGVGAALLVEIEIEEHRAAPAGAD